MPSPEKVERNQGIYKMYQSGDMTYAKIGAYFGISRQCVHQIVKRELARDQAEWDDHQATISDARNAGKP